VDEVQAALAAIAGTRPTRSPFQRYRSRNTFFALMMSLATFNLRVMPNDLMVKLSAYGISQIIEPST
jgi:hypothetical protein